MKKKYLKDYTTPNYFAKSISLIFKVNSNKDIVVTSITNYEINPDIGVNTLVLDGNAKLVSLKINNYHIDSQPKDGKLNLTKLPNKFQLEVETILYPLNNKSGNGIYISNNQIISQCEPEGFREITFYQDRPDVLSLFDVTIISEKNIYNTMLSNGNKISQNVQLIDGVECDVIKWVDPFKKPSYLFAIVIGNFSVIEDNFFTKSKRKVNLKIYSEKETINSCYYAMDSLKKAMKWDEERFNLEYDLDTFMIVATRDFNMGAMENKGLNIFNSKFIIVDKTTSTDTDFELVEAVVAHEYFHNWTGNRVTCRDWFQLSLKEGLTVFRESEFCCDVNQSVVKRIHEVNYLFEHQFPEDSGPLSHPVRPDSYIDINNFYTVTVYEKGAEIVRMYQTIFGKTGFNKGLDLYIKRHDGSAATCEDFCKSMSDANNFDLTQFMLWYDQSGTPEVNVFTDYNEEKQEYSITFEQFISKKHTSRMYLPLLIPIKFALINSDGVVLKNILPNNGEFVVNDGELVLLLNNYKNTFVFKDIRTKLIPSILRNFSAPIKLNYKLNYNDKYILINNDTDCFNSYSNFQSILKDYIILIYNDFDKSKDIFINDTNFWNCCYNILDNTNLTEEYKSIIMTLPTFNEISVEINNVNPINLQKSIKFIKNQLANLLIDRWVENYNLCLLKDYNLKDSGKRKFKNLVLTYIIESMKEKVSEPQVYDIIELILLGQYNNSSNMTDLLAVLNAVNILNIDLRYKLFKDFYNKWCENDLVMNKWFALQALNNFVTIDDLRSFMRDKVFDPNNPNKLYALLRTFTRNYDLFYTNLGYDFILEQIIKIDSFNSNVASGIAQEFNKVIYLNEFHRNLVLEKLLKVLDLKNISNALSEIINKICEGLKNYSS